MPGSGWWAAINKITEPGLGEGRVVRDWFVETQRSGDLEMFVGGCQGLALEAEIGGGARRSQISRVGRERGAGVCEPMARRWFALLAPRDAETTPRAAWRVEIRALASETSPHLPNQRVPTRSAQGRPSLGPDGPGHILTRS